MSIINTNLTSLTGQTNLRNSQSSLNTAMERLSSGLRINSAKDDAAGQAIANRMTAQINGLVQAQRNANDGISAAQTAEGALGQVNDNVQRIRELVVQAKNGTNNTNDLLSIQNEIKERLKEIDRISEQTRFNGHLLLGQDKTMVVQVGANNDELIDIGLKAINAKTMELTDLSILRTSAPSEPTFSIMPLFPKATVDNVIDLLAQGGDADIGSFSYFLSGSGDYIRYQSTPNADPLAFLTQSPGKFRITNYPSEGQSLPQVEIEIGADGTINESGPSFGINSTGGFVTGGAVVTEIENLNDLFNNPIASNNLSVSGVDSGNENLQVTSNPNGSSFGTYLKGFERDDLADAFSGNTVRFSGVNYEISEEGNDVKINSIEQFINDETEFTGIQETITVEDEFEPDEEKNALLAKVDVAIATIDSQRSDLGAIQNRFESTITNLSSNETNLSAARSRIMDADYATEVANMTRAQILQQAGTSVLAQANQIPQNVLSLLG
nr:flagellin [Halomonas sp. UBA3074]